MCWFATVDQFEVGLWNGTNGSHNGTLVRKEWSMVVLFIGEGEAQSYFLVGEQTAEACVFFIQCVCVVVFIVGDGDRLEYWVSEWSPSTGVGWRKLDKF